MKKNPIFYMFGPGLIDDALKVSECKTGSEMKKLRTSTNRGHDVAVSLPKKRKKKKSKRRR